MAYINQLNGLFQCFQKQLNTNMKNKNPYQIYRVVFPYQVRFTLPDDDHNTEIIVNTKSVETYYAKDEEEVLLQKQLSDVHANESYAQHIKQFVTDKLCGVDVKDASLSYTGAPEVSKMTDEELVELKKEIISLY